MEIKGTERMREREKGRAEERKLDKEERCHQVDQQYCGSNWLIWNTCLQSRGPISGMR